MQFVKKHAPKPEDRLHSAKAAATSATSRPKKNKPMNKAEQEAQIEELRGKLNGLQDKAGLNDDSPGDCGCSKALAMTRLTPCVAPQAAGNDDDTSGDDDSEESEED